SFSPHPAQPFSNTFSTRRNLGVANAAILRKRTLAPNRPHAYTFAVAFEEQFIPAPNPQYSPDFPRYRNLSLAGDRRLFLHSLTPYSLLWLGSTRTAAFSQTRQLPTRRYSETEHRCICHTIRTQN